MQRDRETDAVDVRDSPKVTAEPGGINGFAENCSNGNELLNMSILRYCQF